MKVLNFIAKIKELPTIPESVAEVQRIIDADEADAHALASVIERDPTLTARILKVANSALYGPRAKRLSSLQLAIARLGFNQVAQLALTSGIIEQFALTFNTINYYAFWRHSLGAAGLMQQLGKSNKLVGAAAQPSVLYLSGLLHDIGLLIYDRYFPRVFDEVASHGLYHGLSFLEAEEQLLGKESHGFAGGVLLELWKMDVEVIASVRYHHHPDKAPVRLQPIAHALSVVEYLLSTTELASVEGQHRVVPLESCALLGLSESDCSALLSQTLEESALHQSILQ
jgi:HD-like signal output (HDOD) protein